MIGSVRRGQLITTYGVGSMVAVEDQSVMVLGLDEWPREKDGEELSEPRLHIEGRRLRVPPGGNGEFRENEPHIPVVRFPRWYYCANPECRRLDTFGRLSVERRNECSHCGGTLVPSRFIAVCAKGHIEDFPYMAWVHRDVEGDVEGRHDLRLQAAGESASLAGIVIECRDCEVERSLEGAFDREALVGVRACGGQSPWLRHEEPCGKRLRTLARGASNVWFPLVRSALSIPPWSDGLQRFVTAHWGALRLELDPGTYRKVVEQVVGQARVGHSVEEVLAAVADRRGTQQTARSDDQIRIEEFRALCQGRAETADSNFVATAAEPPSEMRGLIDMTTTVSRLREVRALVGFTRLAPLGGDNEACPLSREADWLPAIAVQGEGIFLRLDGDALRAWEAHPQVRRRAEILRLRWQGSFMFDGRMPSAAFLLAHTLGHCLIDQLSLAGGYPAASLRERVYAVEEGVGVLVYTAAADSAGSLGGLIAQARPEQFGASLVEALRRYRWCSSDPVCSETTSQGADGLNLAACHGCALVPETSCEHRNGLLDRALLVGLPDDRKFGFFSSLLEA
jgi:hypothetical protein